MTSSAPGRVSAPIEVRGLTKTFKAVRAVNDLSFDVHAGSITGLLGPAGAGKSTTLRMLLGLVTPSDGSATINGFPISKLVSPARTVGAVLNTRGLHPGRTARAHLDIYAAAIGLPGRRTTQVLGIVGLSSASGRRTGNFSPAMQQRLALATALLGDPEILVLDEPTHGLDPEGAAWLLQFLTTFAESGRTVLITGQTLREVEPVVNHLVLLSAGSPVYDGSIEALRTSHRSRLVVSCSNPALFATALAARGITAATITPDGRLAVSGTNRDALIPVAAASGVTIFSAVADHADLEHLFVAMTTPHNAAGHPGYGPPSGYYGPPSGYYGPTAYGPSGGHR